MSVSAVLLKPDRSVEPRSRTSLAAAEFAAFLVLMLVACLVFGTKDVLSIKPSPIWIPVILLSVHHGTAVGLVAAGAGALGTFVFNWPVPDLHEDYYTLWLYASRDPALWVAAAVLIGSARDWQIGYQAELQAKLRQAQTTAQNLDNYAGQLIKRIEELERHLATGSRPSEGLLQPLLAFRNDRSSLSHRLPALFQAIFGDGKYELDRANPRRKDAKPALEAGRLYSLFDEDNEVAASAAALFVCSLQAPNGKVIGQLAILRIGEDRWGPGLDQRVALFASEVELALANDRSPLRLPHHKVKRPARAKKAMHAYSGQNRRKRLISSAVRPGG